MSRRYLLADFTPRLYPVRMRASRHGVRSLRDLPRGSRVVIACRASTDSQRDNLPGQLEFVRGAVAAAGLVAVGEPVVAEWSGADPVWLARAVALATELGADAIVAESWVRLVRSSRHQAGVLPSADDYKALMAIADGVPLHTVADPDATPAEVHAIETRRGIAAAKEKEKEKEKGTKKPHWPADVIHEAIQLHSEGLTYRQIEARLGVPFTTAGKWVVKAARAAAASVPDATGPRSGGSTQEQESGAGDDDVDWDNWLVNTPVDATPLDARLVVFGVGASEGGDCMPSGRVYSRRECMPPSRVGCIVTSRGHDTDPDDAAVDGICRGLRDPVTGAESRSDTAGETPPDGDDWPDAGGLVKDYQAALRY